jgi:hypothetical protein
MKKSAEKNKFTPAGENAKCVTNLTNENGKPKWKIWLKGRMVD